MAIDYTLNWSNDSLKSSFVLAGESIDTTTTSLALTGKGAVNWGERLQENLIRLLENFASNTAPLHMTLGQQWYNSSTGRMNIYGSSGWKEIAYRRIDSATAPSGTHYAGDLWYDTTNDVLKVYNEAGSPITITTSAHNHDSDYQPLDLTLTRIAAVNTSTDKLIYATGVDTFSTCTLTSFGRSLLAGADQGAVLATLGLSGGGGGSYQPLDSNLTALSNLVLSADKLIYATGTNTLATTTITSFARVLLNGGDAATMRSTLGLSGVFQPLDSTLTGLAGLVTSADKLIYATGSNTFATTTLSAFARTILDSTDAASTRASIGAAALDSPHFSGVPTVPTAIGGTNTTQAASCQFVNEAVGGRLSKSVTSGQVVLTADEAGMAILEFSGVLTGNVEVIVPASPTKSWLVYNNTSGGSYTLYVKTAASTGVYVARGKRNFVYSNGTRVLDAFTDFESIALTGTPTAPTQASSDNSTKIATTAWVRDLLDGIALTGTPTAPNPSSSDSSTRIATTFWVRDLLDGTGGMSFNFDTSGTNDWGYIAMPSWAGNFKIIYKKYSGTSGSGQGILASWPIAFTIQPAVWYENYNAPHSINAINLVSRDIYGATVNVFASDNGTFSGMLFGVGK